MSIHFFCTSGTPYELILQNICLPRLTAYHAAFGVSLEYIVVVVYSNWQAVVDCKRKGARAQGQRPRHGVGAAAEEFELCV